MEIINNLLYKIKQKIYGKKFWLGPEVEIGICDDCVVEDLHHSKQKKFPVRRVVDWDNLYLCKTHWEKLRNNPDPEIKMNLEPFLRLQNKE